jgi:hypothetical protein
MTNSTPTEGNRLAEPIVRSQGVNRSEEILAALCDKAFLPLWCYPNLYRQQAKELADVVVVFGDDVILFEDKARAFPETGKLEVDWQRWYRKSIERSVEQLIRSERWLRQHPTEVYLDAKCTKRFPLPINPNGRFHKVVVARHAKSRCIKELNRSGSLMIHGPTVPSPLTPPPFEIFLSRYDEFVHVLDEVSLPLVLGELDTATDFIDYLAKKEAAFTSGQVMASYGEEETLAVFLTSVLLRLRADEERVS